MNLFDVIFLVMVFFCVISFLRQLRQIAAEKEIKRTYERQKKLFEQTFAELGIDMPAPSLASPMAPRAKNKFGFGWIVLCIVIGIWLAFILRPFIITLLTIGLKDFLRLLFL